MLNTGTNFSTGLNTGFGSGINVFGTKPKEKERFPGLDPEDIKRIEDMTKDVPENQKQEVQSELYRHVLPIVEQRKQKAERIDMTNQLSYETVKENDNEKKTMMQGNIRISDLATKVKDKFGVPMGANDNEVLGRFIEQTPNGLQLFTDYLNGKSEELLYVSGLKERPTEAGGIKGLASQARTIFSELNVIGKGFRMLDEITRENVKTFTDEEAIDFAKENFGELGEDPRVGIVVGHAWNRLSSALKTGTAIGTAMTNPIDTIYGLYSLVGTKEGHQVLKDRYGSLDALSKTAYEDPFGLFSDITTLAAGGSGLLGKGASLAGKTKLAGTLGAESSRLATISNLLVNVPLTKVYSALDSSLAKLAEKGGVAGKVGKVVKPVVDIATMPARPEKMAELGVKAAKAVAETPKLIKQYVSGLSKQQQRAIENNPYVKDYGTKMIESLEDGTTPANLNEIREAPLRDLTKEIDSTLDMIKENISETSEGYQTLRNSTKKIDTTELKQQMNKVLEGTDYTAEQFLNQVDKGNLLKTRDILKGDGTISKLHDVRKGIDTLLEKAKHEKAGGEYKMLQAMRKLVDAELKKDPNRAKLDKEYSKMRNEILEIEEGITYREKRKAGQLKDNIDNIIANINKPAKAQLKKRLEQYFPDLSQRVDAIQMLPELAKLYTKKPKSNLATVGTTALGTAIGSQVGGTAGAVVGAVLGYLTDKALTKNRQNAIVRAIKNQSPEALQRLGEISDAVSNVKTKLGAKQLETIDDIISDIKKEAQNDIDFQNMIDDSYRQWQETKALPSPESVKTNIGTKKNPIVSKGPANQPKSTIEVDTIKSFLDEMEKDFPAKATVKAPEELYHTSTQEILKLTDDKVLRTTPDSKYTLKYGKEGSRNTYKINSEGLNILDGTSKKGIDIIEGINKKLGDKGFSAGVLSDDGKVISFVLKDKNFVAELKKMGYDGLRTTESSMKGGVESVGIITPSKIKSLEVNNKGLKPKNESIPELKATVKAPEEALLKEARKYKSADDFIDRIGKSINEYDGDDMFAKPLGKELERLNFINYAINKYPPKQGQGWMYSVRKIREEANK